MPSIAIVVNSFPKISESFILNKTRLLVESGYQVTVIAQNFEGDKAASALPERVRIAYSPNAYKPWVRFWGVFLALAKNPLAFIALSKAHAFKGIKASAQLCVWYAPFAGKSFDIVHFAFSGLGVAYLPILPFLKRKSWIYVSCRGHAEQIRPLLDPKRKALLRTLFDLADRVHCVSEDILDTCKGYGLDADKVFINRPAVDPTFFTTGGQWAQPAGAPLKKGLRIATVGRLHWIKNHEILLRSVQILIEKGVKIHLDIVGDGDEKQKLVFMAHLLDIAGHVTFHGNKTHRELVSLLSGADVYAHVSMSEGISNAVMEAMSMQLPVVCTDAGGMNELICDGHDGFLVPVLDPAALADKLLLLASDPELGKALGQRARQKILNDFSLDRQRNVYREEYAQQLAKLR
ncbi:MAG: hypothetical protein RL181_1905 [Bacteroidota bacterium]